MSSATTSLNRKTILSLYDQAKRRNFENSKGLQLSEINNNVTNCTFFDAILVDVLVQPLGARVVSLADLGNQRWLHQVDQEGCSLGSRSLALRPEIDDFDPANRAIYRQLADYANVSRTPALINGLVLRYDSKEGGHCLRLVPDKDFEVHFDHRLREKYNEWRFDYVDSWGLPLHLDSSRGSRVWKTKKEGVSAFRLDSGLDLSSIEPLNFYGKSSRIALISSPKD